MSDEPSSRHFLRCSRPAFGRTSYLVEFERLRGPAGDPLIPKEAPLFQFSPAQFVFFLPVAQRLTDNSAGGGVLARLDGCLECSDLLHGKSNTDFANVRHNVSRFQIAD